MQNFGGPSWLRKESQNWNTSIPAISSNDLPEQRQSIKTMVIMEDEHELFTRFSSLNKLIRITALCLRFIKNSKSKPAIKDTGRIVTRELTEANLRLVKIVQKTAFEQDLNNLITKRCMSRRSKLISLNPFIDSQNIIRVGGRLQKSAMLPDAKHPILLPSIHATGHII